MKLYDEDSEGLTTSDPGGELRPCSGGNFLRWSILRVHDHGVQKQHLSSKHLARKRSQFTAVSSGAAHMCHHSHLCHRRLDRLFIDMRCSGRLKSFHRYHSRLHGRGRAGGRQPGPRDCRRRCAGPARHWRSVERAALYWSRRSLLGGRRCQLGSNVDHVIIPTLLPSLWQQLYRSRALLDVGLRAHVGASSTCGHTHQACLECRPLTFK